MVLFIAGFLSCEVSTSPDQWPGGITGEARIDLIVEGAFNLEVQEAVVTSPADPGPVRFAVHDGDPGQAVVELDLGDGRMLNLMLTDRNARPDWFTTGTPFDVYPTAELADRLRYLQAGFPGPDYPDFWVSHSDPGFPKGSAPGVLTLLGNGESLVYGRIRDLELAAKSDPARVIRINGTFVFPMAP